MGKLHFFLFFLKKSSFWGVLPGKPIGATFGIKKLHRVQIYVIHNFFGVPPPPSFIKIFNTQDTFSFALVLVGIIIQDSGFAF